MSILLKEGETMTTQTQRQYVAELDGAQVKIQAADYVEARLRAILHFDAYGDKKDRLIVACDETPYK